MAAKRLAQDAELVVDEPVKLTRRDVMDAIARGDLDADLARLVRAMKSRAKYAGRQQFPIGSMAWIDKRTSKWHGVAGRVVKVNETTVKLATADGGWVTVPYELLRASS